MPKLVTDPRESAEAVGLRFTSDARPGIRRLRAGRGFRYVGPDGSAIKDEATLARIKALAVPPAWEDVWISPAANGHMQASGRDARGRKQYRYHAKWRAVRDETNYHRMIAFARALPALRKRLARDLALPGLPREKVLATVVELLETTFLRVGNREYERANSSYGLTTLKNRHVKVDGATLLFRFRGKAGKEHRVAIEDRRLARIVRACQDLPGHELFQFEDDDGELVPVDSSDVNAYVREVMGEDFTAKDFRTWAGTVLARLALAGVPPFATQREAKKNVVRAIEEVARQLGNTPAVCKKCYVHPAVLEAYLEGALSAPKKRVSGLRVDEVATLGLLEARTLLARRALRKAA